MLLEQKAPSETEGFFALRDFTSPRLRRTFILSGLKVSPLRGSVVNESYHVLRDFASPRLIRICIGSGLRDVASLRLRRTLILSGLKGIASPGFPRLKSTTNKCQCICSCSKENRYTSDGASKRRHLLASERRYLLATNVAIEHGAPEGRNLPPRRYECLVQAEFPMEYRYSS